MRNVMHHYVVSEILKFMKLKASSYFIIYQRNHQCSHYIFGWVKEVVKRDTEKSQKGRIKRLDQFDRMDGPLLKTVRPFWLLSMLKPGTSILST